MTGEDVYEIFCADEPEVVVVFTDDATTRYLPQKLATRVVRSNGVSGTCRCSVCHGSIDTRDAWCRHCGARLENSEYEVIEQ